MKLHNIIYCDPLLKLLTDIDIGSLLQTNKQIKNNLINKIYFQNAYDSIIIYKLFCEFSYDLFPEINKICNNGNLLNKVIRLTNININKLYVQLANIHNNSHITTPLNKVTSDIYYLMEYYHNGSLYDNMLQKKDLDELNKYSFTLKPEDYEPTGNLYSFALNPQNYAPSGYINWSRSSSGPAMLNIPINHIDHIYFFDDSYYSKAYRTHSNNQFTYTFYRQEEFYNHLMICCELPILPLKYKYKTQWTYNFFKSINLYATVIGNIFSYDSEQLHIYDILNHPHLSHQFYTIINNKLFFTIDLQSLGKEHIITENDKIFHKNNTDGLLSYLLNGPKLSVTYGSILELIEQPIDTNDMEEINKLQIEASLYVRYKPMNRVLNPIYQQTINHKKIIKLTENYDLTYKFRVDNDIKINRILACDYNNFVDCEMKPNEFTIPNNKKYQYIILDYEAIATNHKNDTHWNDVGIYYYHSNFSPDTIELI